MLTTGGLGTKVLASEKKGHTSNHIFHIGQKIIFEGEEARIIRLSPFPVVMAGSRIICGALLAKIKQVEAGR